MRAIQFIVGIVCWVLAANFFLFAAAALPDPDAAIFAISGVFFVGAGWLTISRRKRPLSKISKATIALGALLVFGFVIGVVIPDFVGMRYASSRNTCVNNLRQLDSAKQEWALENGETNGTIVTVADITPYIQLDRNGNIPKCPAGGTYILGRVGDDVKCSIGKSDWPNEHFLEDSNLFTRADVIKGTYGILFGMRHAQKP
jgi:hypothetical protein